MAHIKRQAFWFENVARLDKGRIIDNTRYKTPAGIALGGNKPGLVYILDPKTLEPTGKVLDPITRKEVVEARGGEGKGQPPE